MSLMVCGDGRCQQQESRSSWGSRSVNDRWKNGAWYPEKSGLNGNMQWKYKPCTVWEKSRERKGWSPFMQRNMGIETAAKAEGEKEEKKTMQKPLFHLKSLVKYLFKSLAVQEWYNIYESLIYNSFIYEISFPKLLRSSFFLRKDSGHHAAEPHIALPSTFPWRFADMCM